MTVTVSNETTYRAILGAILANRRTELGLRQEEVATAAGVSTPTWSRIEKGENPLTTEQLRRASAALRVSASSLLKLEEDAVEELRVKGVEVNDELAAISETAPMSKGKAGATASAATAAALGGAGMASLLRGASFAVPVVGPVLGTLLVGLAAYQSWKANETEEK